MDSTVISSIKVQIEVQRTELQVTASKLKSELSGIEKQIDQLSAALNALGGGENTTQLKKSVVRKTNGKPAAGKAEVVKHLRSILSSKEVVEESKLKELAEASLTKQGFSRMGVALRFKEAIQDSLFVDTPGGIRLKEALEPALQS